LDSKLGIDPEKETDTRIRETYSSVHRTLFVIYPAVLDISAVVKMCDFLRPFCTKENSREA